MKKLSLLVIPRSIFIFLNSTILLSCSTQESYVCECRNKNLEDNSISIFQDTLQGMTREEAEIECSDYATSDDPSESIECSLK